MINTLDDYIWQSLPEWGVFTTNPTSEMKVNSAGKFLHFRGNTVIFLLNESTNFEAIAPLVHALSPRITVVSASDKM